jgi:fructose-1,6-bisphosphatase
MIIFGLIPGNDLQLGDPIRRFASGAVSDEKESIPETRSESIDRRTATYIGGKNEVSTAEEEMHKG